MSLRQLDKGQQRSIKQTRGKPAGGISQRCGLSSANANSTAGSVLASTGKPLDAGVRDTFEPRFQHDFSQVRIHDNSQAQLSARQLHAKAYAYDKNIVFARGQYQPNTGSGKQLLAHELTHVVQQQRGGPRSSSAAEQEAQRNAGQANGGADISVSQGVAPGIACAPEDWFAGTPGINSWTFTQLIDERDAINQWFAGQTQSSSESLRLEEALEDLNAEIARRQNIAQARSSAASRKRSNRKKERRRKAGRSRKKAARSPAPEETLESLELPRILREGISRGYADESEARAEIDLVTEWLQRPDLTPDQRAILESELDHLTPILNHSRANKIAARRSEKIHRALRPRVGGDAREQLLQTVQVIEQIKPLQEKPGFSYLMAGGEIIEFSNEEVAGIKAGITRMMDGTAGKIKEVNRDAFSKWAAQAKVNREELFASWLVSVFGGESTKDPFNNMNAYNVVASNHLSRYRALRRKGDLKGMANALATAEANATIAKDIVDKWVDNSIATAGNIVVGLSITRDLSFAIVTSFFGGAGFAALTKSGASLVKAGLIVTAAGAGGTGVARGGTNLAGQAIFNDSIDFGEVGAETLAGVKQGTVNSVATVATLGTSNIIGTGTRLSEKIVKGGASTGVGGATSGGLNATLEGKSGKDIIKDTLIGGGTGFVGGGLTQGAAPLTSGRSATTRVVTNAVVGGSGDAVSTLAAGGSAEDAKRQFIIGAVTNVAMGQAGPRVKTKQSGSGTGKSGGDTGTAGGTRYNELDLGTTPKGSGLELDLSPNRKPLPAHEPNDINLGAPLKKSGLELAGTPPAKSTNTAVAPKAGRDRADDTQLLYVNDKLVSKAKPNPEILTVNRKKSYAPVSSDNPPPIRSKNERRPGLPLDEDFRRILANDSTDQLPPTRDESGVHRDRPAAASDRARLEQDQPGAARIRTTKVKESHDLGVEYGRARAESEGIVIDESWKPPQSLTDEFGRGFDDIAVRGNKRIIVEHKGEGSSLSKGQMSNEYVGKRIARLEIAGDPSAAALLAAARGRRLQGVVYSSKTTAQGKIETTRVRSVPGARVRNGLIEYAPGAVEKAYRQEIKALNALIKEAKDKGLGRGKAVTGILRNRI